MQIQFTDLEMQVLYGLRDNCFEDCFQGSPTWVFAVLDECTMTPKQYGGVLTSLIKKGIIEVDGKGDDATIWLTPKGLEINL